MKVTTKGYNYQVCHQCGGSGWDYRGSFNGFNERVVCHQCFGKGEYPIGSCSHIEIGSLYHEEHVTPTTKAI